MKLDLLGSNLLGFGLDIESSKLYINVEGGNLEEGLSLRFPKVEGVSISGSVSHMPKKIIDQSLISNGELIEHSISTEEFSISFKSPTVQRNSLSW